MKLERSQREEARVIARELAQIARTADVLPGSVSERRMRCGQAGCACRTDPSRRHGPYWHWTRKVANQVLGRCRRRDQRKDQGDDDGKRTEPARPPADHGV